MCSSDLFVKCFLGVAELTTQLLRLIGIIWLPLCQINKLGYTYPRRLSRSPTVVGYQDCFLAPLPRSIALSISSLGKYTLAFLFALLFLLPMVNLFETRSYWQGGDNPQL